MASEQSSIRLRFVHGDIKNQYPAPLDFMKSHDYSGHVVGKYPQDIKRDGSVHFEHDGTESGPDGSKGVVIYTRADPNTDSNGLQTQATFLVAWWRSIRLAKVLVKNGIRERFECVNWKEIEAQLNESGQESHSFDPFTRTGASATIGFDGKLEVVFGSGLGNSSS